jgi:hypothetical protein
MFMRTVKSDRHTRQAVPDTEEQLSGPLDEEVDMEMEGDVEDEGALVKVPCPDCGQPIALPAPDEALPVHALCPTPWNPFGLTVCPGSGRAAAGDAGPEPCTAGRGGATIARPTLPEGLDWRLQPFSHAGPAGAAAGAVRLPSVRQAA